MKRTLAVLWSVLSSRALSPVVIGFFLLLYIGIAFFTEEALTVLISWTGRNFFLAAILGLLPLNSACRIVAEGARYLKRRRALTDAAFDPEPALYDETVELSACRALTDLESRLATAGYRTRSSGDHLAAWRGISLSPARIIFLATTFCIFAGILISLTSRAVYRQPIVEGAPFQAPSGAGGVIERIIFKPSSGFFLSNELIMEASEAGQGGSIARFGIYPPALFGGAFVYPRYLGIALQYRFSAPDLPGTFEKSDTFPIYPPGKETMIQIPGSAYKIALVLAKAPDGSNPFVTGRMDFPFKLIKGTDLVLEGSVPKGGEFVRDGIRFAIPDARRMVITDFVVDYGVLLIWSAGFLLTLAVLVWLPVRLFFPRREMLFKCGEGMVRACSHAEGRARKHAGVFHEVLDSLAAKQSDLPIAAD